MSVFMNKQVGKNEWVDIHFKHATMNLDQVRAENHLSVHFDESRLSVPRSLVELGCN